MSINLTQNMICSHCVVATSYGQRECAWIAWNSLRSEVGNLGYPHVPTFLERSIRALCLLLTLMFLVASNPSSWLRSSSIVLCTSLSPPDPPSSREEPMESISSMKMMEGACSLAMTNSSRTIRAPGINTEKNVESN